MTDKLEKSLKRLNQVLPLKERQENCGQEIRELHQAILRSFVENGRSLTRAEMAQQVSDIDDPIYIQQAGETIENMDEAGGVYFGIVWGAAEGGSCCADSLCTEMIFS